MDQMQSIPNQSTNPPNLYNQQKFDRILTDFKQKLCGRRTKFKPKIIKKLYTELSSGRTRTEALRLVGVGFDAFLDWQKKYPAFAELIAEAEAIRDGVISDKAEVSLDKAIDRGELETSKWWLERRRPQRFAKNPEKDLSGQKVIINFHTRSEFETSQNVIDVKNQAE